MLANPTPIEAEQQRCEKIALEHNFLYNRQSDPQFLLETGIYRSAFAFNFPEQEFEELRSLSFDDRYGIFPNHEKSTYGVADNIEQIKEYYRSEIDDPDKKYMISVTPVGQDKENRGKGGGWRWHKWGPYIGKLEPQCEYLDDEDFGDDFQHVLTFQLYSLNKAK